MTIQLKPCPFCGGVAKFKTKKFVGEDATFHWVAVYCKDCITQSPPCLSINKEKAIYKIAIRWNRRVT